MDDKPVKILLRDKSILDGTLSFEDGNFNEDDSVLLLISFGGKSYKSQADDFFDALQEIRAQLEKEGMIIQCNGALRNVYPSPMSRSMGGGLKAYRLVLGKQARTEDLVNIFDFPSDGIEDDYSAIEEQEEFYSNWIASL